MEIRRSMKIKTQQEKKQSFFSKFFEAFKFELKEDKRKTSLSFKKDSKEKNSGIPNKAIVLSLFIGGYVLAIGSVLLSNILLLIVGILFHIITWFVTIALYKPIKNERNDFFERLYSLKRDNMGLTGDKPKDNAIDYKKEFEILEWGTNHVTPKRIRIYIPTRFDSIGSESFLEKFNLFFAAGSTWAPDRSDPNDAGWNFPAGHVTLMRMKPLPKTAAWSEKYLLNDNIAWSFFPIALGSQNGVKLVDDDGNEEFVLGFDVAGAQSKLAKKKGLQIGNELVAAPMVLIAGGTGGGKSLSLDTIVPTVKTDEENQKK